MIMKRIAFITASLLAFASCQEMLIEDRTGGTISVRLENSQVVEVMTKSDEPAVNVNDFNVYVSSTDVADFTPLNVKYGVMDKNLPVKPGTYTLYADNITEVVSLTDWGSVRYACVPVTKTVATGVGTTYQLSCSMVNTAVSVEFVGAFSDFLQEGYKVQIYMEDAESRKLDYTAANTASVGYFKPSESAQLVYTFTGKDKQGNDLQPISARIQIRKATHLTLQFKIVGDVNGTLKTEISVNTQCEELDPVEVTVDPSNKANNN